MLHGDPRPRHPGVRRDLAAIAEFDRRFLGRTSRVAGKVYGTFLKSQGVRGGVASYGRAAGLALAYLDARGLPPEPLEASPTEEMR